MIAHTETLRVWLAPQNGRRLMVLVRRHLLVALIVFASSMLSLSLGTLSADLSCMWIGNGLYIGFVLCINPKRRNELLVAGFIANYVANRLAGLPPWESTWLTIGDLAEAYAATYVFRRMPVQTINLTQVRTLLKVGLYAAVLGCVAGVAALMAWKILVLRNSFDPTFLLSWFCSDAVGSAVTIPLVWAYVRRPRIERTPLFRYDASLAFGLFCLIVTSLFWQTKYPFLFLLFPVLIPVVYTSGFFGAARAVLATSMIGVAATAGGHGPLMLIHTTPTGRILVLQFYLAVVLVTAFPFAVLQIERERLVRNLQKSETRYRELARLDGLTQLPNRREFDSFLDISRQRSVRQGSPLSLLLIDIDHFKKLNDLHGHTVGDEYLKKMAAAIASAVPRKTDLVARYGGEEFAVVLDSCDDAGAMMVAERIKAAGAALSRNLVAVKRPSVTISIGVATTMPELRTSSKVLIDAADQGLYAAKRNGRDRIERGTNLMAQASDGI